MVEVQAFGRHLAWGIVSIGAVSRGMGVEQFENPLLSPLARGVYLFQIHLTGREALLETGGLFERGNLSN